MFGESKRHSFTRIKGNWGVRWLVWGLKKNSGSTSFVREWSLFLRQNPFRGSTSPSRGPGIPSSRRSSRLSSFSRPPPPKPPAGGPRWRGKTRPRGRKQRKTTAHVHSVHLDKTGREPRVQWSEGNYRPFCKRRKRRTRQPGDTFLAPLVPLAPHP